MMTTNNRSFVSTRGNNVTVFQTFETGRNVTGFSGRKRCVRTFAVVNGDQEVEVETGCSFMAGSAVEAAGF